MHSLLLLDMAASAHGDRIAVQHDGSTLTYEQLLAAAWSAAGVIGDAKHVAYVGTNGLGFPIALFGAGAAEVPLVPLNYRLPDDQLNELLSHHEDTLVIAEPGLDARLAALGHNVMSLQEWIKRTTDDGASGDSPADGDPTALLLYTSGTTSAPKAAVLRHRHLTSYVVGSVEFGGANEDDAVLVCVPPYHIAGVANLLSNTYLGRRIVYLDRFDAATWLDTVRSERITNAMVVPTMLARIADELEGSDNAAVPSLKALSYGGARTPATVLERIVRLFPDTGLTNAYGLTETSSTIAVLGPDDHREAIASDDPAVRARLGSAGQLLPSIEVEIRGLDGAVAPGETGDIWVRGEQVSGEYLGKPTFLDDDGWFPTRDRGHVDDGGYLFIEGRSDDTIIRGGENIAPAEIEEPLLRLDGVDRCAVVGVPDDEWGQIIAAVVVLREGADLSEDDVKAYAREKLRGSKTPDVVHFVDELPFTETGKLLRRKVLADLIDS